MPTGTPGGGTHLQRYARRLGAVEINSSFYRSHRCVVYERWAAATPRSFRFAVKVPQEISHDRLLAGTREPLRRFLDESAGLGLRRGPLLLQLPPSFSYAARTTGRFLALLRRWYDGPFVIEPRHVSWFDAGVERLLIEHQVGRVGADPRRADAGDAPAAWPGVRYYRLHGSPRVYWSSYPPAFLGALGTDLRSASAAGADVWCIFDNTASGAAYLNARALHRRIRQQSGRA